MKIEWIGHACFRLTAQDGTVAITDPYDESVGIDMIRLKADLITMSHGHHDHCETRMIEGNPVIARGPELACVGSFSSRAVNSYHDDAEGSMRGGNMVRIFTADGLTIVHMGDQGCMPDEDVLEAISSADVMMIPVGGTYTVDAQGAKAIIDQAKPACVIPMHVKTRRCPYPIAKVDDFLALMGVQGAQPVRELEITKDSVPQGVVLMQPAADEL
ncbi:MAG: MBL fold metallo-hydrolase [Clostridiales bacterium]|nr:MBL fold metallo-hydrolase [Clostridiales bacterium]